MRSQEEVDADIEVWGMDTVQPTVDEFAGLFFGNLTGYGTEEGGCARPDSADIDEYERRIEAHLNGIEPTGIYPLVQREAGWMVTWGCVDFDEGEDKSLAYARNVQLVLETFGITSFVERSRSKGYHVWVFASTWMPAKLMREALLAACQIVEAPTKEINPKSIELNDGQLGNYVRLPYPNGLHQTPERRVVVDRNGGLLAMGEFLELATHTRATSSQLEALAELYEPPKRKMAPIPIPGPVSSTPASQRLKGLAFTIWRDGPLEGGDRSGALWKLMNLLREQGDITYHEAMELINDADQRWGKFHDRGEEHRLQEQLSKAWGG